MDHHRPGRLAPAFAAALALAAPVHLFASDGALEIDQARVATGCFPGDQPGFPVEIVAPGSYVLTSNVQVPDQNTSGIEVATDFVVVDLGGFALSGITLCETPAPCSPIGGGRGVTASNFRGVTIRNGTIRGFGERATFLGEGSLVEDLLAEDNGTEGIAVQNGGIVRGCISRRNGGPGISTSGGGIVTDNLTERNLGHGIETGAFNTVNRNSSFLNDGDGARIGPSSTVTDNALAGNAGSGLNVSSAPAVGYAQNVLNGNGDGTAGGQVSGAAVQTGGNVCAGALCP
jgi:hypothetical protein